MDRRQLLVTVAAVGVTGCESTPASDDTDGERPRSDALIEAAIETRRHMNDLAARRTMTIDAPDETVERVERIARVPPAKQRIEVVESTDPDVPAGSVTVTNRATTWEYNPTTETVDKQYHPNKVDTDGVRLVLEDLLADHELSYEGTETVDGRTAHVIETVPPIDDVGPSVDLVVGDTTFVVPLRASGDSEAMDVSRTVWIDDEHRYPIKERNTVSEDGEIRHDLIVTYEDLSIDHGLPSGTFTYDPPKDATVVTDGPKPEGVFESTTAAEEIVPYDLPGPAVPDSYDLDRVTVVERKPTFGGTVATLWYNDPTVIAKELFVTVRETQRFDPDALEQIEFDGHTAYRRDGRIQSVFWTCDDLSYEVSSLVDESPLLEVASSIGCSSLG
ncbi:LolA family protein [Natrinema halophilum]|uniref:Outer membrane lipoprotein carrier protein LolA n=1 Tax=Natrinema halophilum TaxID=1699371 RepID=A0A7D5GQ31_9EURY|nr:outer membrane lipoprotein carrier protein LolA [Natrinema halophilum]QLG47429.1 DUF2092 domain-containing protein [Natrinema halophilum]